MLFRISLRIWIQKCISHVGHTELLIMSLVSGFDFPSRPLLLVSFFENIVWKKLSIKFLSSTVGTNASPNAYEHEIKPSDND